MQACRQDGNKIPWAQFSQIKLFFSTWNIKSQKFFPIPLEFLHCVTPVKAMSQFYSCWCSYKNSRYLETDTDPLSRIEPYTPRASRKSSPSPMYSLCFIFKKGNKRWSELKLKLWMLWLSLSYPAITCIYPAIYLKSPWKDLPLIEANKQTKKSEKVTQKTGTHF